MSSVDVTEKKIRPFQRIAKKNGISFGIRWDKIDNPVQRLVFWLLDLLAEAYRLSADQDFLDWLAAFMIRWPGTSVCIHPFYMRPAWAPDRSVLSNRIFLERKHPIPGDPFGRKYVPLSKGGTRWFVGGKSISKGRRP